MTTKRTDVHRPSAIVPSDYEYVAQECMRLGDIGDCQFIIEERARIFRHMERTGGTYSRHEHAGKCGVCGNNNAIYTHLFYHQPTNSYVRMGEDCAQKCEMGVDERHCKRFRKLAEDAREQIAGKRKAQALLDDAGFGAAWPIYIAGSAGKYEEGVIRSIVGKLVQYGSISEKAMAYVGTLLDKIATRPETEAQRAKEMESALPAPTGRVEVSGKVLSVKVVESDFGDTIKMLLATKDGWKLWCTMPASINAKRDDVVAIKVTVEPSRENPKFAFGKRPTLVSHTPAGV